MAMEYYNQLHPGESDSAGTIVSQPGQIISERPKAANAIAVMKENTHWSYATNSGWTMNLCLTIMEIQNTVHMFIRISITNPELTNHLELHMMQPIDHVPNISHDL